MECHCVVKSHCQVSIALWNVSSKGPIIMKEGVVLSSSLDGRVTGVRRTWLAFSNITGCRFSKIALSLDLPRLLFTKAPAHRLELRPLDSGLARPALFLSDGLSDEETARLRNSCMEARVRPRNMTRTTWTMTKATMPNRIMKTMAWAIMFGAESCALPFLSQIRRIREWSEGEDNNGLQ